MDREPCLPHDLNARTTPGEEDELCALGQLIVADCQTQVSPPGVDAFKGRLHSFKTSRAALVKDNIVAGLILIGHNQPVGKKKKKEARREERKKVRRKRKEVSND